MMKDWIRTHGKAFAVVVVAVALLGSVPVSADDWLVRLRGVNVDPNSSSSTVRTNGTSIAGSSVSVEDDTIPELDITYFINKNWAIELILGTSEHDVIAGGSLSSLGKIVDSRVLPPTFLVQYHFAPDANFRPYVGLGINLTYFYDEETTTSFDTAAGGPSNVTLDDSANLAGQVGMDIGFSDDWFFNIDLKYILMDTTAKISTPGALGDLEVDVDIDPVVFGLGIGRRF